MIPTLFIAVTILAVYMTYRAQRAETKLDAQEALNNDLISIIKKLQGQNGELRDALQLPHNQESEVK